MVRGRLAAGVSRRPGTVLVANLVLVGVAAALAIQAPERVAVAGGVGSGRAAETLVVVARAKPAVGRSVVRQAIGVIRSGISADPVVRRVEPVGMRAGSEVAALRVLLGGGSAAERQRAAGRIADRIDAGPLEVAVGGEAAVQAAAREELSEDLGRLALLAAPLVLAVLLLAFGPRHAVAPALAAATGALGGVAALGLLAGAVDLGAAGAAVAVAVGLAVGVESCLAVRRRFGELPIAAPEEMLAETLRRAGPPVAIAAAGCAAACLAALAIPLPAARAAAFGGAVAALLAGASALAAMPAVLARWPRAARPEPAGVRGGRLRDAVAVRPWLGWLPALAITAALGVAAAHAFDLEPSVQGARELAGSEPARAAELLAGEARETPRRLLGTGGAPASAEHGLETGIPIVAALLTALGLLASYLSSGSRRAALAYGAAAALPALAVCGLLRLAGKGNLPLGLELGGGAPHAGALIAALAAVGGVSVARAALRDPRAAIAGTLVAGAALAALAASELDGVAQTGIAVAGGLALDLVFVRLALAPSLAHALPHRQAAPRLPGAPGLARLRGRLRR